MTKYEKVVTIVVFLMLGGCQYNGTIDASGLLKTGEKIVITKEKSSSDAEPETNDESYYYTILRNSDNDPISYGSTNIFKEFGPKFETINSEFGNDPVRLELQGESGLFIEYNFSNSDNSNYYMTVGGKYDYDIYTPMPGGTFGYSGKVVTLNVEDFEQGFSTGTVTAEIDFDDIEMWLEVAGTDRPELNVRINEIEWIDLSNGTFSNLENISNGESAGNYSFYVNGHLYGLTGKAIEGYIEIGRGSVDLERAVFVAERNDLVDQ